MKWILYGLIVLLIGAVVYQVLLTRKGGLQLTSPQRIITGSVKKAPGFMEGGRWINSEGENLDDLVADNKLVLVDFWTYSCINCQRTLPYLRDWWNKYQDKGLVIIGVHSPEFEFEKEYDNVVAATEKYDVGWPVVQDNEMKIWRAYNNHYWPAKYVISPKTGEIIYSHFGEGAYEETENLIKRELTTLGYDVEGVETGEEGEGEFVAGQSPETYLGWQRGSYFSGQEIAIGRLKKYMTDGQGLMQNTAYLQGEWRVEGEYAESGEGAMVYYRFYGGEANLVMSADEERMVEVYVDGEKTKEIKVMADDLYNLYEGEVGQRILQLKFEPGVRAFAFTFGR